MTTNSELSTLRDSVIPRGVSNLHRIFVQKAKNAEIWDVEGNRYIDLAAGIAVLNVGHNHPHVIAAVREQLEHFSHTCFQVTLELAGRMRKAG